MNSLALPQPALGLFGQSSSVLSLSATSQLLSAASFFQDQVTALRPGASASGIGQNFGNDEASLAAEAQFLVDAVNGVQQNLSGNGILASSGQATAFVQELARIGEGSFDNGESSLTRLSQLGITAQTSAFGTSTLSIDLDTLKSAFAADPAGAFSLLDQAAQALGEAAGSTVAQAQGSVDTLGVIAGLSVFQQSFGDSGLLANSAGGLDFAGLLLLDSLQSVGSGGASPLQNLVAINQFNLVSSLI
ncbi:hypothetical protein LZ012_16500 [Dechloromonas sp. XY25]|uniref:Flagellin n=1 Tax=Dechloromonas hankyongensis TaxID=2908002 RepID=A0ABS9K600_9RHOO|nr:hypothetical protein [Dechloromonas hankyongensis]MCG2578599.1 hypothetical protein [Dechloromonas hankyongensis]